jgi:prepilin-type N-terminal cleavage/methylation domain-containing protein
MIPQKPHPHRTSGFTLIELMVVILLISLISAVSFPKLLPLIYFTELEGSARHLTHYGRNAIAQATFMRDPHTVKFDLTNQEYFTVHWVDPDAEAEMEEEETDQLALLRDYGSTEGFSSLETEGSESLGNDFDQESADKQFNDRFAKFARRGIETRAP